MSGEMAVFIAFFIICVIGAFLLAGILIIIGTIKGKRDDKRFDAFIEEEGIQISKWDRFWSGHYIIYDEHENLLWVYHPGKEMAMAAPPADILGCELKIDEDTEYRTSLSSAAGRAIIGGVLAGGVGAVLGGVTARKDGRQLAHRVDLTLYFNSSEIPYLNINVYSDHEGVELHNSLFRDYYNQGMHWCKFIEQLAEAEQN